MTKAVPEQLAQPRLTPGPQSHTPGISVVIPTLNEALALPANLTSVLTNRQVLECIVVDGGSRDGTCAYVDSLNDPRVTLLHSPPGRGLQMNKGASQAQGDMLLFHHADTQLTATNFAELGHACNQPEVLWGGFSHQFSEPNWKLNLVSWLHNFRFHRTGVVYGDQSMFIRRDFFQRVGGFAEEELEDLDFSDRAIEISQSTKLVTHVVTDSRKFVQIGELRALAHVVAIILRYQWERRTANERFFEPYR